jgi:Putative zinc-finger
MVTSCEKVWGEISNYLDGDVDPAFKAAMEEHFKGCKRCSAVLAGTRNIVGLYGDERMLEVPAGFERRLHRKLEENMPGRRGTAFGWVFAFATMALIAGGLELARSSVFRQPEVRSAHADPAKTSTPPDMMVIVSEDGKTFHRKGCSFIHDKAHLRIIPASQAIREGYVPCIRCMREYQALKSPPGPEEKPAEEIHADLDEMP